MFARRMRQGGYADANDLVLAASAAMQPVTDEPDEELLDLLEEAEDDVANGRVHKWADVRQQISDAFLQG